MYSEQIMIQEAEKCSRCGVCAAVCPVFRELQRETYSSRGKTEIAKALVAGELPYSSYTEDIFSKCLLCLTCKGACPAGVDQGKLILGIRAELVKRKGLPFSKKVAFKYLLKNRSLFEKALKSLKREKILDYVPTGLGYSNIKGGIDFYVVRVDGTGQYET